MPEPTLILRPAITADTSAYAAGDALHTGALVLDVAIAAQPYGLIMPPVLTSDTVAASTTFDMVLYSGSPSASTITANAAHSIAAADQAKVLGVFNLDKVMSDGSCSIHFSDDPPIAVRSADGLIYASVIVRGTGPTLAAADINLAVPVMRQG